MVQFLRPIDGFHVRPLLHDQLVQEVRQAVGGPERQETAVAGDVHDVHVLLVVVVLPQFPELVHLPVTPDQGRVDDEVPGIVIPFPVIQPEALLQVFLYRRAQPGAIVHPGEIVLAQVQVIVTPEVLPDDDVHVRIQDLVILGNQFRRDQPVVGRLRDAPDLETADELALDLPAGDPAVRITLGQTHQSAGREVAIRTVQDEDVVESLRSGILQQGSQADSRRHQQVLGESEQDGDRSHFFLGV